MMATLIVTITPCIWAVITFEGIFSKLFIAYFEIKLRHCVRIYIFFSSVVSQVELKFRVGDVIYVYGGMDEDGFFTVSEITLS